VLHKEIKIINEGTDTLTITAVHPGCDCTTAPLDHNHIVHGDTATISLSLDVKERTGEQRKSLMILSNDTSRPSLLMVLTAFIKQDLISTPIFFPMYGNIKAMEEYTTSISIRNQSDSAVVLQPPAMSDGSSVRVSFNILKPTLLKAGEKIDVNAHVVPLKVGYLSDHVIIRNSSHYTPELKISLYCRSVKGD
jgi:hypothetical protein